MKNFSRFECDFTIKEKIKENDDKSIYTAILKRHINIDNKELLDEVIIIKIHKKLEDEILLLTSLKHKGIPKVFMLWEEEDYIIIIQEKVSALSLFDYVNTFKNIPNNKRLMIAYELAKIIDYLHKSYKTGLVHADISPNNIMISDYHEVYLIDFGSSFVDRLVKKEKSYYGTIGYYSPKIVDNPMSVDKSIDIYSFAMILKLLEIDKISIEAYELYKKCVESEGVDGFDMERIMLELLNLLN